ESGGAASGAGGRTGGGGQAASGAGGPFDRGPADALAQPDGRRDRDRSGTAPAPGGGAGLGRPVLRRRRHDAGGPHAGPRIFVPAGPVIFVPGVVAFGMADAPDRDHFVL